MPGKARGKDEYASARKRLDDERQELLAASRGLVADSRALAEAPGAPGSDDADVATDVLAEEIAQSLKWRVDQNLAEVERALESLAAGTYGRCEDCGGKIDPARLEARPTARRCLACQQRAELYERRGRHSRAA